MTPTRQTSEHAVRDGSSRRKTFH